ncbi:polysaccharide pyruvyl transferase family protein [Modestobacter sp. VKM Ac-2984]|uniref:polysaccharide pyruvyl transferase family protein n=1 Tax=Modestobacter sp. VKM Ac-2984 TaxID=3004138 RepID=UPI0022AB41B7|nr:polysaccharide pyruvyl transferase family protein [Modestobacter sp. VKM Ac-2984]MCZ2817754.1 polysaccharide pyruvyl transferase family protein [Modestobacter sp. VKM Ac-2984]
MRALVLWADQHSPNLGVRALAEGTAALLGRVWPGVEVVTQNYGSAVAPVRLGDPRALAVERVTRRAGLREWVRDFDVVVDTRSGDSFSDIYGLQRLFAMSWAAEHVHSTGVPLVLGPQTIGPFDGRRARALARRSLGVATTTMARDHLSADHAAELGRPVDVLTTDVVFALDLPARVSTHDVLLNVSGLLWRSGEHVDSDRYRQTVGRLHEELVRRGRRVALLAHVLDSASADNDVRAAREFAAEREDAPEVLVPTSLAEVRRMVAGAELVIGSRMHACLNALSVGTPAVPLAYSRKFEPLLAGVGWPHLIDLRTEPDPVDATLRIVERTDLAATARGVRDRAQELLVPAETALRRLG